MSERIGHHILVPAEIARKYRRKQQQDALARARYEYRNPYRNKLRTDSKREWDQDNRWGDKVWEQRPFIMWDGEGPTDAGYALFGNSEGHEICHPFLGTEECLELIMDSATENPGAINIAFGFNYDVSNILRELPKRHLRALKVFTRTIWLEWELEHVPHKWFKVKRGEVSCTIYDIRSFFAGGYVDALDDFSIGTVEERERIRKGKTDRPTFVWAEIEEIRRYYRLELKLGPLLAETMRKIFGDAGYIPRSWHGPGALARMALKRHKIYDAMAKCPPVVRMAAMYAFIGGHFELWLAGHINGPVHSYDLHSAYPHFATMLPNLAKGRWEHVRNFQNNLFGVYYIEYNGKPDNRRVWPLPRRLANGNVVWTHETHGWYWAPEAELVKDDPYAKIREGWVFIEDNVNDRPFAFLAEYYARRQLLKGMGNAAEYTFKLIINAIYGQLAQRTGWDRKNRTAPKSHQLEWAGFITSACRAEVYRAAIRAGSGLISVDTDGIYTTRPIDGLDCGESLGQWEHKRYDDGIFWQSGIYCLKDGGEWKKAKSRGIKKGSYTAEDLFKCLKTGETLRLRRHVFVTYGLADNNQWDKWNTWIDEPHEFELGGGTKRQHYERACKHECNGNLHKLYQWPPVFGIMPGSDPRSYPHHLPWLNDPPDSKHDIWDYELFDDDELPEDDLWVREAVI